MSESSLLARSVDGPVGLSLLFLRFLISAILYFVQSVSLGCVLLHARLILDVA